MDARERDMARATALAGVLESDAAQALLQSWLDHARAPAGH